MLLAFPLAIVAALLAFVIEVYQRATKAIADAAEEILSTGKNGDEEISIDNIKIFVEPSATMYILGSKMDYVNNELESGFIFNNPNEKGRCGCGESFHI